MKLGDIVLAQGTIRRTGNYTPNKNAEVFWVPNIWAKPRKGIFIGWRTLSDGEIEHLYSYDEGSIYHPKKHFKVALVVFTERTNPVYVPLDMLQEVFA